MMVVWLLRRLAPRTVRRRALYAIPPERRLWAVRRVIGLGHRPRRTGRALGHEGDVVSVTEDHDHHHVVRATITRSTSPAEARRANVIAVTVALAREGIPYLRIPAPRALHTGVAVLDSDRERVLDVLLRSPLLDGAYLRRWDGGRARMRAERIREDLRTARVIEVFRPVTDPTGLMVLGAGCGCDLEFWTAEGDALVGPRANPVARVIPRAAEPVRAKESSFGQFCRPDDQRSYPTRPEFSLTGLHWITYPIDAVYTWVDGSDPRWQQRKIAALADNGWAAENREIANASRFLCRDELRYSLRSLYYFAPWIRRIFLVTDDQSPPWLDTDHPMITLVSHRDIFGSSGRLPTFNSHAIESRLHRISGLAEHFLYLNDDVFFGRPVPPNMFFAPSGRTKFFLSRAPIDQGPPLPEDPPVMCAAKNNRDLIARRFGRLVCHKFKHTPHAERRSVLQEIEDAFPDEVLGTSAHQFRHRDDLSMTSSLHHYWSYLTGRAEPGRIRYMYTDLADPVTPFRLATLLARRHFDAFCLNDTDSETFVQAEQADLLSEFLPSYFPFAAPFERPPRPRAPATPAIPGHRPARGAGPGRPRVDSGQEVPLQPGTMPPLPATTR